MGMYVGKKTDVDLNALLVELRCRRARANETTEIEILRRQRIQVYVHCSFYVEKILDVQDKG